MEQPTPDDADWTWVLERPCPDCGFDARAVERSQLGAKFRANAAAWRQVLGAGDRVLVRPPGDEVRWSALEYGAHVRDVYARFGERVELMLKKQDPQFANWDQDVTALEERYWEQDPGKVSYALAVNAGKLADTYDRVGGDEWDRTGRRSDGSVFTIETLGLYCLHDPVHHLWDVEQGFEAIDEANG